MTHLYQTHPRTLLAAMMLLVMAAPLWPQRRENSRPQPDRTDIQMRANDNFNQALVKGNTGFALGLYNKLRLKEGNLFFSPYSVSSALSMTFLGARGETAKQMSSVLRLPADQSEAARGFGALNKSLNGNGERRPYELDVANA